MMFPDNDAIFQVVVRLFHVVAVFTINAWPNSSAVTSEAGLISDQLTPVPRFFCHKCSVEILPVSWSTFTFYWNMTYSCDLSTCILIVTLPVDERCILWTLQWFVIGKSRWNRCKLWLHMKFIT
jgi:hypothetical protein